MANLRLCSFAHGIKRRKLKDFIAVQATLVPEPFENGFIDRIGSLTFAGECCREKNIPGIFRVD